MSDPRATSLVLIVPRFIRRVVKRFLKNKGILLSGAVGYNTLLSVIPLFAVLLVALSHIFDEQLILSAVGAELSLILPGKADDIVRALSTFMSERHVIGTVGIAVMLFFSSLAFRILEDAMAVIFHRHKPIPRHPLISAIIPYIYIGCMGLGLMVVTGITAIFNSMEGRVFWFFGDVARFEGLVVQLLGFAGLVVMLTSIYQVMPPIRVSFKRALIGGLTAAVLWEIVRNILVWYFDSLSLVNVIYGSLATIIILLLSLEIAAVIILLGAQVIAELERAAEANQPWYAEEEFIVSEIAIAPGQEGDPLEALTHEPPSHSDAPVNFTPK